ncbi:hypothetical protein OIV83_003229 [Microbotryomycetes sp. JL201]|nr:hypothetical protein OIV83_003229 [Microbotryomycetes sp. JL201]
MPHPPLKLLKLLLTTIPLPVSVSLFGGRDTGHQGRELVNLTLGESFSKPEVAASEMEPQDFVPPKGSHARGRAHGMYNRAGNSAKRPTSERARDDTTEIQTTHNYSATVDAQQKRQKRAAVDKLQDRAERRDKKIKTSLTVLQSFADARLAANAEQAGLACRVEADSTKESWQSLDGPALLKAILYIVTPAFELDSRRMITSSHPLGAYISSNVDVARTLFRLSLDPLCVDLASLPALKRSTIGSEVLDDSTPIQFYLRVLKATVAQHQAWSTTYTQSYPAGIIHEKSFLAATSGMTCDAICHRIYAGVSSKKGGEGRAAEDEGKCQAHLLNFVKSNSLTVASFEFYELDLTGDEWVLGGDTILRLRAHPMASALEELLIAVLGASQLNSHPGGLISNYKPDQTLIDVLDAVNKDLAAVVASPDDYAPSRTRRSRLSPTTTLDDIRQSDTRRIEKHADDCVCMWNSPTIRSGPTLSRTAIHEVKTGASGLEYAPDGYPVSLRCLKDVTRAEFDVEETGSTFFGSLAGHGPRLHLETLAFVRDGIRAPLAAVASSDSNQVAKTGAAFFDFWIVLVHKEVVIAIILWIRMILFVVECPVLIITSSKLAALIQGNLVNTLVPWPALQHVLQPCFSDYDSTRLLNCQDSTDNVNWHDLPIDGYLAFVGTYDPLTAPVYRRLLCLVEAKIRVAQVLGAVLRPAFDQESLQALSRAIDHVCIESGLEAELFATRSQARDINFALGSVRSIAVRDRQLEADVKALMASGLGTKEAKDAARARQSAKDSVQMSSITQNFVATADRAEGPPRSEARRRQIDRLAAIPGSPAPLGLDVGSTPWVDWLINVEQDTVISCSARATNRSIYDYIGDDLVRMQQYQESRQKAEAERQATLERNPLTRKNPVYPASYTPARVLQLLDDPNRNLSRDNFKFKAATCRECQASAFAGAESKIRHVCVSDPLESSGAQAGDVGANDSVLVSQDNHSLQHVFYPFEVIESPVGFDGACPADYISHSVFEILQRHPSILTRIPLALRPGDIAALDLGQIYVKSGSGSDSLWIQHQAYVRLVLALAAQQRSKGDDDVIAGLAALDMQIADDDSAWVADQRASGIFKIAQRYRERRQKGKKPPNPVTYRICNAAEPCGAQAFGINDSEGAWRVHHVGEHVKNSKKTEKNAAVFANFLALPYPMIRRVLLGTWERNVAPDKRDAVESKFAALDHISPLEFY